MTHRVLVTDSVALSGLTPLTEDHDFEIHSVDDSSTQEFVDRLAEADALIVRSATKVTRDMLSLAPRLKAVGRAGVGVDNVDLPAASDHGVAVFNAPGGNTIAAAELTMALLIAVARKTHAAETSLRGGSWSRSEFQGVELKGKTIGLIGAGRIGTEVAQRCRAFAMHVLAYDPYLPPGRGDESFIEMTSLDDVIERSDFISIHVPLSDETHGMVGAGELARMKKSAFLVNASRGGVVDESALADALRQGEIAGAALDVYEKEPLPPDSPLRTTPNLVLTPHLGAATAEAQVGVATEVAGKISALLKTGDPAEAINASSLM